MAEQISPFNSELMEKDITGLKLALNLSDCHEKQALLIEKNGARAILNDLFLKAHYKGDSEKHSSVCRRF